MPVELALKGSNHLGQIDIAESHAEPFPGRRQRSRGLSSNNLPSKRYRNAELNCRKRAIAMRCGVLAFRDPPPAEAFLEVLEIAMLDRPAEDPDQATTDGPSCFRQHLLVGLFNIRIPSNPEREFKGLYQIKPRQLEDTALEGL